MSETAFRSGMSHDFAFLGGVRYFVRWEKKGGQDKRERCAEPSTLGRFLVSQGVSTRLREVRKNHAMCERSPSLPERPVSCTSRYQAQ